MWTRPAGAPRGRWHSSGTTPGPRHQHRGRIVNISSGTHRRRSTRRRACAASKAAVNIITTVARQEIADAGITVSLVVPSITATEFVGGRFRDTAHLPSGLTVHSPQYVGRVTLRALDTGAARIDVPPGPGQPDFHEPTVR
ncbi:MAG TPA: SDR family NAD(P)-dependent oxidoreductase [Rugosimonospora sp.]|nr:SDR family NAD(P)-dependent oxidoreductase [Rugosimonospora sp.]